MRFSNRNFLKLAVLVTAITSAAALTLITDTRISLADTETVDKATAKEAFVAASKVFFSPRCANCHPAGDVPTQGDQMLLHTQGVTRGPEGKGVYGMKCTTCHQQENLEGSHLPPGVSTTWHMPPSNQKMIFQGRTAAQLCRQLKDPKQNGGHDLNGALLHLKSDPLVLWGWSPGNGRTLPPMSYDEFMKNIKIWTDGGAPCPE